MPANWITVDTFSEQTGIHKDEAQRKCRSNEWPQGIAWMYYSDKIRLINLEWWDQRWQETARAFAKQQKTVSRSSLPFEASAAANASNVNQLMETLEK